MKSPHSLIVIPIPTLFFVSMVPGVLVVTGVRLLKDRCTWFIHILLPCHLSERMALGAASQRGLSLCLFCQPDASHQRISLPCAQEGEKTEEAAETSATVKGFITAKDTLQQILPQCPLVIRASLPNALGTRTIRLRRLRGSGHDIPTWHSETARQREMGIQFWKEFFLSHQAKNAPICVRHRT